jgi:hypothetical protein
VPKRQGRDIKIIAFFVFPYCSSIPVLLFSALPLFIILFLIFFSLLLHLSYTSSSRLPASHSSSFLQFFLPFLAFFMSGFCNDAFSSYTIWRRMEWLLRNYLEGSGRSLINLRIMPEFVSRDWGRPRRNSVRITKVPAEKRLARLVLPHFIL